METSLFRFVFKFLPELPLLKRELIEQANRRRTYVLRFLGAIAILSLVLWNFSNMFSSARVIVGQGNPNPFQGSGGMAFKAIVPILFRFIQAVMPALICGSIAMEKERNTLGTLFVTRLSPMTIVLEKLGSRLIPMFSFLLLTFPVLAFVYSLGGVDTELLFGTMWLLFVESLLFASLGLVCSSFFSTTVTAFIWSYVLTGLLIVFSQGFYWFTGLGLWTMSFMRNDYRSSFILSATGGWVPGGAVSGALERSMLARMGELVWSSLPILLASVFLVMSARFFLFRRAFTSSSSILLRVFKAVDRFFTDLNDRTTGGVVLVADHNSLPAFDPIAWRERTKKSLGKARYLFRILLVMEGPTLFICVMAASSGQGVSALRSLLMLMWAIATIILLVKSATVISSERTRETLDALLSTPLTGREILQQKINGIGRLMVVLSVPIFSIHFTLWLMHVDGAALFKNLLSLTNPAGLFAAVLYPILTVATTFFLMHFICWSSAFFGLRSTSQTRSVSAAISGSIGWCAVVLFLSAVSFRSQLLLPVHFLRPELSIVCNEQLLMVMSPGMSDGREFSRGIVPPPNAFVGYDDFDYHPAYYNQERELMTLAQAEMLAVIAVVALGVLVFLIRLLTLRMAPRLLGRKDECSIDDYFRRRVEADELPPREAIA
jgi:ABC-type transport system involved in multi-copper enzyme maturation permease subunit